MQIHAVELSRRQASGHEVDLWIRLGDDSVPGVRVHRVPVPFIRPSRSGLSVTGAFMVRAAAHIRRHRPPPDVVHLHGDFIEGWMGSRLARTLGVASVLTVHGGLNSRYRTISRRAFAHLDAFIALGSNVVEDLEACGVPAKRITKMSSGLSWELLDPWMRRPRPSRFRVVSVGTLDRVKGHDVTIEAIRQVRREFPETRLQIIGDGPERAELEALALPIGSVEFSGHLPRERVYEAVSGADIFVLASRRLPGKSEGVPTALLEALALGLPVVTTRS